MINLVLMFDEINKTHFDNKISKIPVNWNARLKTTAGYCKFKTNRNGYYPTRIDLNKRLFENENYCRDKIFNTLAHEMTHAYLLEHYNEKGHTARFQSIMTRITGVRKNHRCHSYNVTGLRAERNITISCPIHGEIGTRSRMPKAGLVYRCRRCRSKITFKKKTSFKGLFDE